MEPNQPYQLSDFTPQPPKKRIPLALIVLAVGLAFILLVAGIVVREKNLLPASVPLIGMDSGVAACKVINGGEKPLQSDGGKINQEQYLKLRRVFDHSRYPAIRDNGLKLVDSAWQIQGIPKGEEMSAFVYIGTLTSAYAGLAGGCAEAGYPIPALSAS